MPDPSGSMPRCCMKPRAKIPAQVPMEARKRSNGAGADVMKRIAAPMVGGIITSFLMELVIYPPVFAIWKWNWEVKPALKRHPAGVELTPANEVAHG